VSSGATGSKTASMTPTKLSGGISLVIDCNIGSLCPGSEPQEIAVSVSPSTVTVPSGTTLPFGAQVTGTNNTAVTWTVEEPGGGSITTGGLYTAPNVSSNGTYHVRATSQADSSKFGRATVTVTPGVPPIVVSVSPNPATVGSGGTQQFVAQVTGTSNTAVTWTVEEPGGGSITTGGLYTAPNVSSNATYHVRATSQADSSKLGRATVTVTPGPPPITVSVSPNPATVGSGGTRQFVAQVTGTNNTAVTWGVDEPGGGSITVGGLYTAPSVTSNATYHVRATSVVDTSKFGEATVNVTTGPSVSISPKPASTTTLGTIQFSATVSNLGSTAVTWSIDENSTDYRGGHIDTSGKYTAPAAPGTFTVRATSQANSNITDTSTVTVTVGCMEALAVIHAVGSQTTINMVGKVPLQVDKEGRPVVVWVEYGPYTAYVARYEDNGWHQLGASLPSGGFAGPDWVDLAIDSQDRMAVGYEVFNSGVGQNEIHVGLWDAGVWNSLPAVPQGLGNNGFALRLDGAGHPVVALARNLQSSPFRDIAVAQWTGSSWAVDGGIYATAGEIVSLPELIIDPAGDITVAWEEAQPPVGGFGVFRPFAKKLTGPGAGFLPSPRPDADYYEGGPALAFDSNGSLTMAWSNYPDQSAGVFSNGLEVTTWNGSAWSQVGTSLPGLPSVVVPEHNGTPFNPHRLIRNPDTGNLAAATMATVNDIAAVYEHINDGSWPLVCAEMRDATQADDLARGNELTGLAYDAVNQTYVLASTSGAGSTLFVARIKQAQ